MPQQKQKSAHAFGGKKVNRSAGNSNYFWVGVCVCGAMNEVDGRGHKNRSSPFGNGERCIVNGLSSDFIFVKKYICARNVWEAILLENRATENPGPASGTYTQKFRTVWHTHEWVLHSGRSSYHKQRNHSPWQRFHILWLHFYCFEHATYIKTFQHNCVTQYKKKSVALTCLLIATTNGCYVR